MSPGWRKALSVFVAITGILGARFLAYLWMWDGFKKEADDAILVRAWLCGIGAIVAAVWIWPGKRNVARDDTGDPRDATV